MRFIHNGPSISDALLQARDESRVVFFCGAGFSQARAGLPNFFGLAESVIRELGAPSKHAYLSEGWATEFFREIVRGSVVIFVGYSADDPPVHYLLEGLWRNATSPNHIYAFQADESAELLARWQHKGVAPIPYSAADDHRALWQTLEQWAFRADDPHSWQQSVLNRAMAGPRQLRPWPSRTTAKS